MLDTLDLSLSLAKSEYAEKKQRLQARLFRLARACWEAQLPTVVVFEGWGAAGRGTVIRRLTQRLEPRGFSLYVTREPRSYEKRLPWMWRFWNKLPGWGEIAIFDRSWYGRLLFRRVEGSIRKAEWKRACADIQSFERMLTDDRYALVKFFLHISKGEQRRRLERIKKDPASTWKVESADWGRYKHYDDYKLAVEELIAKTDGESTPWKLIAATSRKWTAIEVFETLIHSMEANLRRHGFAVPAEEPLEAGDEDQDDFDGEDQNDGDD